MITRLHKNATTSYALRKLIKQEVGTINAVARKYNLSWKTVKKWRERSSVEDKSSRPRKLRTSLNKYQEDLIILERKKFKKSIEDIYFSVEMQIPNIYPVKIYRCLRRYGLNILPEEFTKEERKIRKFKKYTIGYLHIDTLYTPKIDSRRWYVFTCIDRISKIAFIWVSRRKTKEMGTIFLKKVLSFYPYRIRYILTDNGGEFTNKVYKDGIAKRIHPFDLLCRKYKINHRTIKFKHPWTNGMVERFNQKVKTKVFKRYMFEDVDDLKRRLVEYINDYNFKVRLKQLNYKTPNNHLKEKYNMFIQRIVI
jgi:hypothetical protein